ncbi:DUF4265 domain-containing protein [Pseudomonas sp. SMSB3]|uniref:DUF4265 domain-containing protein n=1 Tax=Pseudomonas sp. SMSB3 TaxID=3390196 RepID=UPI003F83C7D8
MSGSFRKILFRLAQDASGYPPASVEGLWAHSVQGDEYRVDSIPFHVYGIAPGDRVSVSHEGEQAWFATLQASAGASVFRVLVKPPETVEQVQAALVEFGCICELEKAIRLLAVAVPAERSADTLIYYLLTQREAGTLEFEEGVLRHPIPAELR